MSGAEAGKMGGDQQELLIFWRIRKEDAIAEAVAWSHPQGVELRIMADGAFVRGRVFEDPGGLVEYAQRELVRLEDRGWVLMS